MVSRVGLHLARRVLFTGVVVAALFALMSSPGGSAHAAGSFDSTTEYFFCNRLSSLFGGPAPLPGNPACTSDLTPGATPDFGFHFNIQTGDYIFSTFAVFVSDGFSIADDAALPDGTVVGGITNSVQLGLTNNACDSGLSPEFILYDSTTNTANTVNALPEGTTNRFANLVSDDDGFTGKADADSPAVQQYPSFLNTLLDPDLDYPGGPNGLTPPISPHARYTGLTKVAGNEWTFLSILVFEKSQLLPFTNDPDNATHPLARYGRNPSRAGWVLLLVLQDPTEIVSAPSAITDFCTEIDANAVFLGQVDTNGDTVPDTARQTSPATGTGINGTSTHLLMLYGLSTRDTDGDGLENNFDTCPFTANLDDPRATSGADSDMIDPACDPTPNTASGPQPTDHDGDGFPNGGDNCPLTSNPTQAQAENTTTYILAAPDAGPKSDSIGDACDSEFGLGNGVDDDGDTRVDEDPANGVDDDGDGQTDEDGAGAAGNTPDESSLPLGSDDVADGGFLHDMNTGAVCIGGVDTTPADGFCDSGGETYDANNQEDGDDLPTDGPPLECSDSLDNDADTKVDTADPDCYDANLPADSIDTDGDNFANYKEIFMQTDPLVDCPQVSGKHDAWPVDFDKSRKVDILDIVQLTPPVFNTAPPNPNYTKRKDLDANNKIDILDIVQLTPPVFNTSCTP